MKMLKNGKSEKDKILGPFVDAIGGSRSLSLSCGLIRRLNVVFKYRPALAVKRSVVTPPPLLCLELRSFNRTNLEYTGWASCSPAKLIRIHQTIIYADLSQ